MDKVTNALLRRLGHRLQGIFTEAYKTAIEREKEAIAKLAAFDGSVLTTKNLSEAEIRAARLVHLQRVNRETQIVNNIAAEIAHSGETAAQIIEGERLNIFSASYRSSLSDIDRQLGFGARWDMYDRNQLKAILHGDSTPFEKLGAREVYERKQREYIRERAYGRLGNNKIIVQRLQNELTQAVVLGEGIPKIATRIKAVTQMSRRQAVTVARTETLRVANQGRMLGFWQASDMGIEMQKRWIATHDSRTRPDHAHMDGETVGMGEAFSNGLDYPLDPSGPPEQVINCRCTTVAVLKGFSFS